MPPHIVERHNLHPLLIVRGCGNPAREEHLPLSGVATALFHSLLRSS